MQNKKRNYKKAIQDQSGFTLLEIIAVIVILSILSVVAVPKYFDLQTQARSKAMDAAAAEVIGRINGYFAEQILSGEAPADVVYGASTLDTDTMSEEFAVTFNDVGADDIEFVVSPIEPGPLSGAEDVTKRFGRPGI